MKARFTAWVSALLLLLTAVVGVPAARVCTNRVSCSIVYSQQKKYRAEQVSELREPAPPDSAEFLPGRRRERAALPILDSHLFQRPPPQLS